MVVSSIALIVGLVVLGIILLTLFLFSLSPEWWLAQNEEIARLTRDQRADRPVQKVSAAPLRERRSEADALLIADGSAGLIPAFAFAVLSGQLGSSKRSASAATRSPKFNRIEKLMSEEQLYELARRRIDRRNRRGILLGVDIFAFLIYVGAFVALYNVIPHMLGVFIALAWLGVLIFHVIILSMTQNRNEAIEQEVAKLRDQVYEKPKRLELNDDGELVDFPEIPAQKTRDQG